MVPLFTVPEPLPLPLTHVPLIEKHPVVILIPPANVDVALPVTVNVAVESAPEMVPPESGSMSCAKALILSKILSAVVPIEYVVGLFILRSACCVSCLNKIKPVAKSFMVTYEVFGSRLDADDTCTKEGMSFVVAEVDEDPSLVFEIVCAVDTLAPLVVVGMTMSDRTSTVCSHEEPKNERPAHHSELNVSECNRTYRSCATPSSTSETPDENMFATSATRTPENVYRVLYCTCEAV